MVHQPVLINGKWQEARFPVSSFQAINPSTGKQINTSFPVSSFLDIDEMLQSVEKQKVEIRNLKPELISEFLTSCSLKISENGKELCELASEETALPINPRLLNSELPRMVNQLKQAASFCLDRSWCQATIDSKLNIRSKRAPLDGPVVIFGPSNFPLAFNAAGGGDFASAIASGNSVIAKGNPNHPQTSMKLAKLISQAAEENKVPKALFQYFHNTSSDLGFRLASHPMIGAMSFTGSRKSGLSLKESADRSGNLIFLEMSGINPVFLLPESLNNNVDNIADEFVNSCLNAAGQFCTKPGLVFVKSGESCNKFVNKVISAFEKNPQHCLLTDRTARNLDNVFSTFLRLGAEKLTKKDFYPPEPYLFPNTVLKINAKKFLNLSRQFQEEAFGPLALIVEVDNNDQFKEIAKSIEGTLVVSVYAETSTLDEDIYSKIEPELRNKCGRITNNKMPTGVAVSPAMVHGGPFPSTGNPGFTSVGLPASMNRFTTIQCYDSVYEHRLPDELKNINPTGSMVRYIDGCYTTKDVEVTR